jgi:YD repeat-containing protein
MSVAERRAALQQALQLRNASRYPEALTALMKAGNAGERRAAVLAAVAFEEGVGTNANADSAALWHLVAGTGSLTRDLPMRIEWLGDGAIRYHVNPNHQRVTFRADGSWTRELLHERIHVKDGADALEGRDSPQYVITEDAAGDVTVTDWRGGWWSLRASAPEDRLQRDERTGDLTFVDDLKKTVTLHMNGRRTIVNDSGGNVRRWALDAGGRLIGTYDAAGKATSQYQHAYRGEAEPAMVRFINPKGEVWGLTPLDGGRQRWTLLNGDKPEILVKMDLDSIKINRANSYVVHDRNTRRILATDGTQVDETRRQEAGGGWVTEKKVGDGSRTAYTLVTYERGSVYKQELKSGAGHFVRGGDGGDYRIASWWAMDKSGKRQPGRVSVGDIFIDDNGTLIKRNYLSEPDPDRPGDVRARKDGRGNRIVDEVTYIFTSGETEQRFSHGGVIRRDAEGDVLWTITPGGEVTRYYYRGEGQAKTWIGLREGASPRWAWVDHWASRMAARDNHATASVLNVTVNRRSGDAEWAYPDRKARTTYRVDGSRRQAAGEGASQRVIEVDAKGRTTRFLTPENPEFRLYYAADGRLERVDHLHAQGFSIAETGYQPPPGLPLTAKEVLRGGNLEFLGWGDQRYVSFLNAQGRRVNFWSWATVEEHEGEANTALIRVSFSNNFTVVKRGHEKSLPPPAGRVAIAERIERLSGTGRDESVIYSDPQGRRFQQFSNGALSEFDAAGKLIRHTDARSRSFEFGYSKDGSLESAVTPDRRLRRGSLSGGVVGFQLTKAGDLLLILQSGFEVYRFPDGRKVTVGGDGTLSQYDHRDRLSYQETLEGKSVYLFYDSETAVSAPRNEVGGISRPLEGAATVDIALDQGRLRSVERSVRGRDGKTTRTVIARLSRDEWIDDEQHRYSAAWISQAPRRVFLVSDHGMFMRVIHEDGSESRVGHDSQYERRFLVVKNAWGEVTDVRHANGRVTHFNRDEAGKIVVVQQGPDALVLDKKAGAFGSSIGPGRLWVGLQVNSQGAQIWTGKNGVERVVAPDDTIELKRPDGSRLVFGPDGTRRHVFAGRQGASLSEVTALPNGDLEWTFSDGTVGRYAAHGTITESLTKERSPALDAQGRPRRSRGHAAVNTTGDLSLLTTTDRPGLVIRHADGGVTEFESAGAGTWKDPRTSEVFLGSLGEIQRRLTAIGAATPGLSSRHMDFTETEGANRYRLSLGMFEFESLTFEPARPAPRRPVSFVTRKRPERPIASVRLKPDDNPQIGYAATEQRQSPPR